MPGAEGAHAVRCDAKAGKAHEPHEREEEAVTTPCPDRYARQLIAGWGHVWTLVAPPRPLLAGLLLLPRAAGFVELPVA